ncbi:flagellar hook-length control protein FliK [Pseudoalteromonas sp. C2R02]|uniref:flagellar hook-length control protein FliK n=1 Tax=Pseudoalteromonas sp. C2R02 TaxID=2841565 RepID=UPI001C089A5C|nr:flagellar hook-length control protein FliK [Pseudoalteromonas sp. C2R02]MBU2969026.1 flagellar hook-length control protein FliK [Pseudoalteromonas sp. C2R02]
MVSIDTGLPISNNSLSKQSIENGIGNKQDSDDLFATMFSAHVNDDQSGNKLPKPSDIDLLKLDNDIKIPKALIADDLKNDGLLNKAIDVGTQVEALDAKVDSDDSFLSQIQASNKMNLTVSDEVVANNELKKTKLNLGQSIDVSKAAVKVVEEKTDETTIINDLKNSTNTKEAAFLKGELPLNNSNLNEVSPLKGTDNFKDSSIILKSDIKESENNLELGKLDTIKSEAESSSQATKNDLPKIKLDASLNNQLNQVLPELSEEQKNQLKKSLESVLAELDKLNPSTEVVSEVEKLSALLLQVDELITKDKISPDHLIKTDPLNEESKNKTNELVKEEVQIIEKNVKTQSKFTENITSENSIATPSIPVKNATPIESNISNLTPKSQEQNFALGKDKNDTANLQNAYTSEINDLVAEEDSLVNIKSSAELSNTAKVTSPNSDTTAVAQINKSNVNSIFNDVIRQLEPQPVMGVEFDPVSDLTNSITSTQTSTSLNQKLENDKLLQQPINIARSDAAKLLNERVTFMLSQHNPQADIRLDPPELGSMIIRIRTDAEQAQINFSVQNQEAKELLEDSMPKLKEMLAEQGIDLGESNIEQQQQGQNEQASSNDNQKSGPLSSTENDEAIASVKVAGNKLGGVDFYA